MERENYYRVTEVLCPFNGYGAAPANLMKQYQRRGTIVHKACNRFTEIERDWYLDLVIDGVQATDEEINIAQPYIDSFSLFWKPSIMKVITKEERLYDDDLQLTGEPDFIISINGVWHLPDIKTSKVENKTWPYQLAGYQILLGQDWPRSVIQLKSDGSIPNFITYNNKEDKSVFIKALELYKIFCPRKKVDYEEGE